MKLNVLSVCSQYSGEELLASSARAKAQSEFLNLQWEQGAFIGQLESFLPELQRSVNENKITVVLDGSENFYTKTLIADGLDLELTQSMACCEAVEAYCEPRGLALSGRYADACRLPEGAEPMCSKESIEQGFLLVRGGCCIAVFPAHKEGFGDMFSKGFFPFLLRCGADTAVTQTIALRGSKVKDVEEYLRLFRYGKNILPLIYQEDGQPTLSITAIRKTEAESRQACESLLENIEAEMGSVVLTAGNLRKEKQRALPDISYDPTVDMGKGKLSRQEKKQRKEAEKQAKAQEKEAKKRGKSAERSGFGIVRKILLFICICTFLGSAGYLGLRFYRSMTNLQEYDSLREVYDQGGGIAPIGYPSDYDTAFSGLYQINQDVVGWLSIEGTSLDYPVVQYSDNEYYHRLNFEGESNLHGVPYVDYSVDLKAPSNNTIIYGHNVNNDDQMFNALINYQKVDYYKEHPIINFHTVYGERQYKIFAAFVANVNPEHGEVFQYHTFVDADSVADMQEFLYNVQVRSVLNTGVDVLPSDELLTLSTCTYEFDNARFVVVARRVRDGESAEVDTSAASRAANPLMPDIWYELYGGTKPVLQVPTFEDTVVLSTEATITPEASVEKTPKEESVPAVSQNTQPQQTTPSAVEQTPTTPTEPEKLLEKVSISGSASNVDVGGTLNLSSVVEPVMDNVTYNWSSSDTSVATVSEDGVVTAVAQGQVEINLTVTNADQSENTVTAVPMTLTITAPQPVETVLLNGQESLSLELTVGDSNSVTASGSTAYTWKSSDEAVAGVSKKGLINALAEGTATITVTGANGDTAELALTVKAKAEQVLLDGQSSLSLALKVDDTYSVTASGSDSYTWASDDEDIAYVSKKGKITAMAEGTATITVTGANGGKAEVIVTVAAEEKSSYDDSEELSVKINGKTVTDSAYDIVCQMVQAEMGSSFQQEALKAQAVAAYTYVKYNNSLGIKPAVAVKSSISSNVASAVQAVIGEAIYYNGAYINATYCAANAGVSNNCVDVWGGNLPYLVSVESEGDKSTAHYGYETRLSLDYVAQRIESYHSTDPWAYSDDPGDWFGKVTYGAGKYVNTIKLCGSSIKGRLVREGLLQSKIRSAAFEVEYDADAEEFIFTTYGYGHGVGMSQLGANYYAQKGWSYVEILEHYYSGTKVK